MSESKTITVPMGYEGPAQSEQPQEKPAWARRSLHAVQLGQVLANSTPPVQTETTPVWTDHGNRASLRWEQKPVEQSAPQQPPQQPYNAPVEYAQPYAEQPPQALQPPNPEEFDFWDPESAQEYRRQNDAYMQEAISRGVQEKFEPYQGALTEAVLRQDYSAVEARYGQDENYRQVLEVALERCVEADKAGKKFSIIEEYQRANDQSAARLGERGNAHLPKALGGRGKKIGQIRFGEIMLHNQMTGRSGRR